MHFCYLKRASHFVRSKKLTNKKQKIFSKKQKGFWDGLSYSTPQKSKETRGNAITQPPFGLRPTVNTWMIEFSFSGTWCSGGHE